MIGLGDWIDEHEGDMLKSDKIPAGTLITKEVYNEILEEMFAAQSPAPTEVSLVFTGTEEEFVEFKKTLGNLIKDED